MNEELNEEHRKFLEGFASELGPEKWQNFIESCERFSRFFDAFGKQVQEAYKIGYAEGYREGKQVGEQKGG